MKEVRELSLHLCTWSSSAGIQLGQGEAVPMIALEIRRGTCEFIESQGGVHLFKQLIEAKLGDAYMLQRVRVVMDDNLNLYGFFGLHSEVDTQEVLLAAVYLQRLRFREKGLELEFMTEDYHGVQDTELNILLEADLDTVDIAGCREILRFSGRGWDEWE